MRRYQACVLGFTTWCVKEGFDPSLPEEYDDLLVEWKNATSVGKPTFEGAVAAVEFFYPRMRGQLGWSRSVLTGWGIHHVARHTVPMTRGPSALFAANVRVRGHARLGLANRLQQNLGLRPSEVLGLLPESVLLPEEQGLCPVTGHAEIVLGIRVGTKAKRPQVVILRGAQEPELLRMLRLVKNSTPEGRHLFPYSQAAYGAWLRLVEGLWGVAVGYTPHSPRGGFASERRARGDSFTQIQEDGRWLSATSLRIYIDIAGSAAIAAQLRAGGLQEAQAFCAANLSLYLTDAALQATYAA